MTGVYKGEISIYLLFLYFLNSTVGEIVNVLVYTVDNKSYFNPRLSSSIVCFVTERNYFPSLLVAIVSW